MTDDRGDLTQLIYRLYACMDEGRFTDLGSVFAETIAVRTPGGLAEGKEAVIAQAARNHSPVERVQHFVHNVLVDVEGDHAGVRADVIVTFSDGAAPEGRLAPEPRFTLSERFRYEAIRSPEGWRLSRVDGTPVWASERQLQTTPAP
ncbi:nuclear transport factor 2 family protein [Nonomuraea zeae]|uniref:Nuclear transport factor 2 family protein n=1 Tax=Nonomuraea zeae TaxID=1642303 RepID=A0A5S4GQS6_9ACTN|nr:nuclear transport factor 2 family protein [Nonomuraea zeae]TMR34891.1 nuclear transport factor 2 family protein [Nonomuraea zeae]